MGSAHTFKMNLQAVGKPVTMYSGMEFTGFAVFNGKFFGSKSDGLFTLFDADKDNGVSITSTFEWWTDFGSKSVKKVRALGFQYWSAGDLDVSVVVDEGDERVYTLSATETEKRIRSTVIVGKDAKGVNWCFKVNNTGGKMFSVDKIVADVLVVGS